VKGGEKKMKRNRRINKFIMLVLVTLLTIGLLIVPSMVFADKKGPLGIPVEIDVSPYSQYISGTYCGDANWTVRLSGGTSGPYYYRVSYGDGKAYTYSTYKTTFPHSHPYCSWSSRWFYQTWKVWRAGGGEDYDYTKVYLYIK